MEVSCLRISSLRSANVDRWTKSCHSKYTSSVKYLQNTVKTRLGFHQHSILLALLTMKFNKHMYNCLKCHYNTVPKSHEYSLTRIVQKYDKPWLWNNKRKTVWLVSGWNLVLLLYSTLVRPLSVDCEGYLANQLKQHGIYIDSNWLSYSCYTDKPTINVTTVVTKCS